MKRIFLQARRIALRALEPQDLTDRYLQWLNDERVCAGNGHAVFPNTRRKMRDYFKATRNSRNEIVLAIVTRQGGRHIGNVSLIDIDWVSRSAAFAILVGDLKWWGKGIGIEAGKLVMDYAFTRLNLHRVHCGTLENNVGMQKLAAHLHMRKEGRRREAIFKTGKYIDILEYGVLKREYMARERS